MDSVVVYGPAFEACTAIKQLAAAGVSASKVKCLSPAGQKSSLSAVLAEAAALAGTTLPETTQVCRALVLCKFVCSIVPDWHPEGQAY